MAEVPAGVSPTSPRRTADAGLFVVARVGLTGEVRVSHGVVNFEPGAGDRWVSSSEAAELLGIEPSSWRNLVHRGVAPAADDPDAGRPANRREPRWLLSTVLAYKLRRRPRGGQLGVKRGPRESDGGEL